VVKSINSNVYRLPFVVPSRGKKESLRRSSACLITGQTIAVTTIQVSSGVLFTWPKPS
jgi:hypothetical protein